MAFRFEGSKQIRQHSPSHNHVLYQEVSESLQMSKTTQLAYFIGFSKGTYTYDKSLLSNLLNTFPLTLKIKSESFISFALFSTLTN